jgi:hypothetical protein
VRIKAIECHKLGIARLERYFEQLVEVETDFEAALGGTTDTVAQAAHYYHFHVYKEYAKYEDKGECISLFPKC